MARLASQEKMGYYPTPETEIKIIRNLIKTIPDTRHNVLDICAGTGEFSRIFPDLERYAVELDYERYQQAKKVVKKAQWGDAISEFTCSRYVFSCLYLNPPYDWSESTINPERMELVFLRKGLPYLQKNGLLIFVIPRTVLKQCAKLLANNFKQIKVAAFTKENYPAFSQVVVFGYRQQGLDKDMEAYLKNIASSEDLIIPHLDKFDGKFTLKPARDVKQFKTKKIDPEEAAHAVKKGFQLTSLYSKEAVGKIKTIMPLRQGHKAMLLASGHMNGVYGTGGNRVLVKGSTRKHTTVEETKNGRIERESIQIVINSINLSTGELTQIK